MNNETGGPAFPVGTAYQGLTIRDYFAARAMAAFLSDTQLITALGKNMVTEKMIATRAFDIAAAMLEARK